MLTGQKYGLNWDGLAVFRGHTLAGFLDEDEAALFGVVRANRFQRTVEARIAGVPGARAAIFIQGGSTRRRVRWEPDRPVLEMDITVAGDLQELTGMRIEDPASQRRVEAALEHALAGQVTHLVRRLQELDADPIGFGELARRAAPYREEVQDGAAWHAVYRQAPLSLKVRVTILRTGFLK